MSEGFRADASYFAVPILQEEASAASRVGRPLALSRSVHLLSPGRPKEPAPLQLPRSISTATHLNLSAELGSGGGGDGGKPIPRETRAVPVIIVAVEAGVTDSTLAGQFPSSPEFTPAPSDHAAADGAPAQQAQPPLLVPSPPSPHSPTHLRCPSTSLPHCPLAGRAAYFLLGAGLLAAWNALITATDYFGAVYPGWHTDRLFTVSYLPVCLLLLLVGMRYPDCPSPPARIRIGYLGFTVAMAAVPLLDALLVASAGGAVGEGSGSQHTAAGEVGLGVGAAPLTAAASPPLIGLVAVVICVVMVGACDGLCQGALFGEVAQLPPPYTQAVVSGTASSGLLVCVMRIVSKASFEAVVEGQDADVARGLREGTQLYFVMSGLLSLSCLIVYDFVLPQLRSLPTRNGHSPPSTNSQSLSLPPVPANAAASKIAAATAVTPFENPDRHEHHEYEHGYDLALYECRPLLLPQPPLSLELSTECRSASDSVEGSERGVDNSHGGGAGDGDVADTASSLALHSVVAVYATGSDGGGSDFVAGSSSGQLPVRSSLLPGPSGGGGGGGGDNVAALSSGGRGGVRHQMLYCLSQSWPLCASLFVTYTVTLSIFPGFLAEDVHSAQLGDWYPILLITAYNLADLVGKSLPVLQPVLQHVWQGQPQLQGLTHTSSHNTGADCKQYHPHSSTQLQPYDRPSMIEPDDEPDDDDNDASTDHPPRLQRIPLLRSIAEYSSSGSNMNRCGGGECGSGACGRLAAVLTAAAREVGAAVVLPLRRPGGLLAVALLRGAVMLPAFLVAARWQAPAWVMAALTTALGVSNGYLTSQVLTMGPSAVLTETTPLQPSLHSTATAAVVMLEGPPKTEWEQMEAPAPPFRRLPARLPPPPPPPQAASNHLAGAVSISGYEPIPAIEPIEPIEGGDDSRCDTRVPQPLAAGDGAVSATVPAIPSSTLRYTGEGHRGRLDGTPGCESERLKAGACGDSLAPKPAVDPGSSLGGHSSSVMVETLLVISLVAGLNVGAYLGWLWLL